MKPRSLCVLLAFGVAVLAAGTGRADEKNDAHTAIGRVLDDFHAAASEAHAERYFGHLTEDAVFLGTDATERWPKAAFEAFAKPYFEKGTGWTHRKTQRHVSVEPGGERAFFDELLENASYGVCRGSGVLRREGARWRIAQYDLSIPMPNPIAKELVGRIRAHDQGLSGVRTIYFVRHAETEGDARDRPLSDVGLARAKRLAAMLRSAGITKFVASTYRRTVMTLEPAAEAAGCAVIADGRDVPTIVAGLRSGLGGSVLVAGHSNTVPAFLRALGLGDGIEIAEDEHDNLFVVTLPAHGTATLRRLRIP